MTIGPVTLDDYQAALLKIECGECGVYEAQIVREWVKIQTDCVAMYKTACLEDESVTSDD